MRTVVVPPPLLMTPVTRLAVCVPPKTNVVAAVPL